MFGKSLLLVFLLILFPIFAVYAQEESLAEEVASEPANDRADFWISIGADTAFYNTMGLASGGSFALGYGSGSSIGLKGTFFFIKEDIKIFELDLLLRFYLLGKNTYWGPFLQFAGGASLVNNRNFLEIPSSTGVFNAGFGIGWRSLFLNRFFLEPSIRLGYPYFMDLGVSAGIRF